MDFLTDDTDDVNEGNRKKEISDRLEEYVDQQKQIVMGFELEKKKILGQEANGQNMDLSSVSNDDYYKSTSYQQNIFFKVIIYFRLLNNCKII